MKAMTKLFARLAVFALLATAEASAASPGSTRSIETRLATTLLRAAPTEATPAHAAAAVGAPCLHAFPATPHEARRHAWLAAVHR